MKNEQHGCCHELEFSFSWREGHQVLTVTCEKHRYEQSIELEKVQRLLGTPWLDEEEEGIHLDTSGLGKMQ